MFDDIGFVVNKILELEKKYVLFFRDKDFKIRHCVKICREDPISIHVVGDRLPNEIKWDIEEMFYSDADRLDEIDIELGQLKEDINRFYALRSSSYQLYDSILINNKKLNETRARIHRRRVCDADLNTY
jgi:hypothetical protein